MGGPGGDAPLATGVSRCDAKGEADAGAATFCASARCTTPRAMASARRSGQQSAPVATSRALEDSGEGRRSPATATDATAP